MSDHSVEIKLAHGNDCMKCQKVKEIMFDAIAAVRKDNKDSIDIVNNILRRANGDK